MFRLGKSLIGVSRSLVNTRMLSTVSNARIFFANIPWKVSEDQVSDHFSQVGNIIDLHLFKNADGRLVGSGVIEYDNAESAQKAIQNFHDADFQGRKLLVREDRGKSERSTSPRRPRQYGDRNGDGDFRGDRNGDRNGNRRPRRNFDDFER
mmetsp:Transcript_7600/g.8282  ORF Transcript_7600/g.8282 Transcript_7600/m.8282 type:complete len:151 (+) Transcript_7600:67-519(+)|eukprot:CAMPEP_0173149686 /NCGR_PEP_ID=MMETSP1105-20130129/10479_1 /TAXON_ID=2985 /ORGANISM="Ochromonas sp., Strain BG-1" /LENGTH=150 /DNA_ID=CAMNT_0014064611 /DNA_START=68 /DNA_END=520 /DNA_ORIENTATION=+